MIDVLHTSNSSIPTSEGLAIPLKVTWGRPRLFDGSEALGYSASCAHVMKSTYSPQCMHLLLVLFDLKVSVCWRL